MRCRFWITALCLSCAPSATSPAPVAPGPSTPQPVVEPVAGEPLTTLVRHGSDRGWPSAQPLGAAPARTPIHRVAAPVTSTCVTPDAVAGGDPQPDLELRVTGPRTAASPTDIELAATIRNVSTKRAHAIVLPGDGSGSAWRDPVISFTAFIDEGDGCWHELPAAPIMRCGLFDPDWTDEVVTVRAGKSRSIDPLWSFPPFTWRSGNVRLFVHYAWTGGTTSKGAGTSSVFSAAMAREKPYELVSNAIEFRLTL